MSLDPAIGGSGTTDIRPAGTVVLLLASSMDREWAADRAVELSSEWAAGGRRIVLADLQFENPLLHERLDLENLDGVVDIFLYGASLARSARPVRGGSFYFIPAGTYESDPSEIYRHPRWRKLVAGFRDTGATLILFVPEESADLASLSSWSREAIVLGQLLNPGISKQLEELGIEVLGSLAPETIRGPDRVPPVIPDHTQESAFTGEEFPWEVGARPEADPATRSEDALAAAGVSSAAPQPPAVGALEQPTIRVRPAAVEVHRPPESELELPPPPVRRGRERRATPLVLWVIFGFVLVVIAGYLLFAVRPDLFPGGTTAASAGDDSLSTAAAGTASPPGRLGEYLPFSIQVKAFTSLPAAEEEMRAGQEQLASVPFYIAPQEIQGILYFNILAGLAPDTGQAIRLRDRLVEMGTMAEEDAVERMQSIQFTPLAFDLGEFVTEEAATARAGELRGMSIPVYSAEIPYSDGTSRWQLYAGAYRDSISAVPMGRLLENSGIPIRLTVRTGVPATLPE